MIYTFQQHGSDSGRLELFDRDPGLRHRAFAGFNPGFLTIAWNTGPDQRITVDEVPYPFDRGQVICLVSNQTFRCERPEEVVAWRFNREFYCIVDHDAEVGCAGLLFYGNASPLLLTPDAATAQKLTRLLPVFIDEFGTHDDLRGDMLRMLLKRLILLVNRLAKRTVGEGSEADEAAQLLRQFNLLVEQHYRTLHRVSDYAKLLYRAPKTLANVLRGLDQPTPSQLIRQRIALEGRRLLIYTERPVSEISEQLGFLEPAHFTRMVKAVTGYTPTALRKRGRGAPPTEV